jgi:RHS repeat-associated protein
VFGRKRAIALVVAALVGSQALLATAVSAKGPTATPTPSPQSSPLPGGTSPSGKSPLIGPLSPQSVLLPYGSAGYRYKVVAYDALPGFEQPSFDDVAAGFSNGTAAFGNSSCGGGYTTLWDGLTDVVTRMTINVPAGTAGVRVSVAIDNDVQVFWNGTDISGGLVQSEGCATPDEYNFVVPDGQLSVGNNLLAVRGRQRDSGSASHLDLKVTAGLNVEPAPDGTDQLENQQTGGDPVDTYHGNFLYHHTDVSIPGRGPAIAFMRSYNSADTRVGPMGPGWTHGYNARLTDPGDSSGDVLLVGPDGNTDRFTHNQDGTFSPAAATYAVLVRNANGSYTVTKQDQTRWDFDGTGRLTKITDRFGNASMLVYDPQGHLATISDPAGRGLLTLLYVGTNGQLSSVTDWASPARSVLYGYDNSGRLQTVTDREGKVTTYAYDGTTSRITTITDARNNIALTLTYDAQGRVATQKDARGLTTGDVTTFDYVVNPDNTRVTTVTHPTTSFESTYHPIEVDTYAANSWLTSRVSHPTSTETLTQTYTYDTIGDQASVTDPRGNRTDFCYDVSYAGSAIAGSRGNLTRVISPPPTTGANRPVTLTSFDAKNNVIQTVAPKGVASGTTVTCATDLSAINANYATDLAYDASSTKLLSSTTRFTDPDAGLKTAVIKFEYSDGANPGLVTKVIPPRGNTGPSPDYTYATTMTYFTTGSRAGLLASVADALGNTTTYDYDAVGRLLASVDQLGNAPGGVAADHTTNYVYDKEDRVRFVKLPPPAAGGTQLVTETRYDVVGNPTSRIDANGQVTTYAYDERDALFQVKESPNAWTDPASPPTGVITTQYAYDAAGYLTRMTRAMGDASYERVTDYTHDGRGLLRRETQYPAWPTTTPTLVTAYAYDPNGNPATLLDPLGQTTTSTYDALNRLTLVDYSSAGTPDVGRAYDSNGNRTSMTDGTGTTSYVYDEANRLTSVTSPGPNTIGYRYDLDGNRTKLIYPDATAVTYTFDKASQLSSLLDWASRSVTYAYFPDGLVKTTTKPDTSIATYTYDNARRMTGILEQRNTTVITKHTYSLDPVGNVTQLQEFVQGLSQGSPGWLDRSLAGNGGGPAIAFGADGGAYAVWVENAAGLNSIHFARRDPATGSWGPSEVVAQATTSTDVNAPAIAVDGANNVYVVWNRFQCSGGCFDPDIYFSKRTASTGTWSSSVRVSDDTTGKWQFDPAIALSPTGAAVAVWVDWRGGGSKKNIYSSRLPAGSSTWAANIQVTSNTSAAKASPRVAIGVDGTAYAAWADERNGGQDDIYFASLPSGSSTWSANVKVSDDPGTALQLSPDLGVDTAGNITVVWRDYRVSPATVRGARRPAGNSNWTASVNIGGSDVQHPRLAVRSDGRAYAVWQGPSATGSEYNPTTGLWSAPEPVSAPTEAGAEPSVAINSSQLIVLYEDTGLYARIKPLGTGYGGPDTFSYGYDKLYRLTSVTGLDGNRTYAYDPAGNRSTKVLGGSTAYTYDRADRILTVGSTSITVNVNGNLTVKGVDSFAYDQANRPTTATVAGSTETYVYDGDGTRFTRQLGTNSPIRYVSDINRTLPVTIDDGTRKYVYALGLVFDVAGSSVDIYHTDRLGSVRALTNASGTVTAAYRSDEYGILAASSGSSSQPFGFTGEPRDATALTYLRARYYDPSLGRFMSRDTWHGLQSVPGSLNDYAYLRNDPLSGADPDGHCGPFCAIAGGIIGGLGGAGGYVVGALATGHTPDPWQAVAAAAGGAVTGAVCGVTLGASCLLTGAATSLIQYQIAPGDKTAAGYLSTGILGGVLGRVTGGSVLRPLSGGLRFGPELYPSAIGRFLANYAGPDFVTGIIASGLKSFGASFLGSVWQELGGWLPWDQSAKTSIKRG